MSAVQIPLKLWQLPNFIRSECGKFTFPIAQINDEDLRQLGDQWVEALIKKAQERRERK